MRPLADLWIFFARLRQRRAWRSDPPREELIARFSRGRSFADIGAMWAVHRGIAFPAGESGGLVS
jgi:hypothetical protein